LFVPRSPLRFRYWRGPAAHGRRAAGARSERAFRYARRRLPHVSAPRCDAALPTAPHRQLLAAAARCLLPSPACRSRLPGITAGCGGPPFPFLSAVGGASRPSPRGRHAAGPAAAFRGVSWWCAALSAWWARVHDVRAIGFGARPTGPTPTSLRGILCNVCASLNAALALRSPSFGATLHAGSSYAAPWGLAFSPPPRRRPARISLGCALYVAKSPPSVASSGAGVRCSLAARCPIARAVCACPCRARPASPAPRQRCPTPAGVSPTLAAPSRPHVDAPAVRCRPPLLPLLDGFRQTLARPPETGFFRAAPGNSCKLLFESGKGASCRARAVCACSVHFRPRPAWARSAA